MEAVKDWARSLFLLSIFSSTALLLVPKSMQRQARFVAEMLILLCVVGPLASLFSSGARTALPSAFQLTGSGETSLGEFYAQETARRVAEIAQKAGIPVKTVNVTTSDTGLSLKQVAVYLSDQTPEETLAAFRETVAAYLGVPRDKLKIYVPGSGQQGGP